MSLAGRAVLVRYVITAIPIYLLIAIRVPKWFIRAVDKIRKSFFVERKKGNQWWQLLGGLGKGYETYRFGRLGNS